MDDWQPVETDTHQDHVIAHVLGATALGYFVADETAHFVLDIGFIWTILLDSTMGLVPHSMALNELNVSADERAALTADVHALYDAGTSADVTHVTPTPDGSLIEAVEFYANDVGRRLLLQCEAARISIETELATGAFVITAAPID
ncbi:MAG: hypothetical protein ACJ74W_22085 [Pyrinomonadaceae bacterium]